MPTRSLPESPGAFQHDVKRTKHDGDDVMCVDFEEYLVTAVDMAEFQRRSDEDAEKDSVWMWEEPTLKFTLPITDKELIVARQEEVDNLNKFGVLKYVHPDVFSQTPDAKWIGSRWEDVRKDSGCVRSRWVLQEFATSNVHGDFHSATPDALEIELVHLHALDQELDLGYIDVQRAFLHAPEIDSVFTWAPAGHDGNGSIVQLMRKVNGRRDGSKQFGEWFAVKLQQRSWKRSRLHPCTFTRPGRDGTTMTLTAHVDDAVIAARSEDLEMIMRELREDVLLKETGRLPAGRGPNEEWVEFLGKRRKRVGSSLCSQPKPKFVDKAAYLLGLTTAKTVSAPTSSELYHREGGTPLEGDDKSLVRQVVGLLQYVHKDYRLAQLAMRGLATEVDAPTEDTMMRLKHLVRYLLRAKLDMNVLRPDGPKRSVTVWSDSDWAGDRKTRKSVDCVVVEVLGTVVSVSTKGQMAIAQSSAEAELGGAHRAALMAVGVQNTWLELFEENLPIGLLMDSAAGKIMAVRRGKGKVRHLEVKQLYMQELTNALRVKTYKAKGEENKADIGTKPMTARTLEKFYAWLGIEKSESADVIDDKMTDEKQIGTLDSCLLKRLLGTAVFATLLGVRTPV